MTNKDGKTPLHVLAGASLKHLSVTGRGLLSCTGESSKASRVDTLSRSMGVSRVAKIRPSFVSQQVRSGVFWARYIFSFGGQFDMPLEFVPGVQSNGGATVKTIE